MVMYIRTKEVICPLHPIKNLQRLPKIYYNTEKLHIYCTVCGRLVSFKIRIVSIYQTVVHHFWKMEEVLNGYALPLL